MTSVLIVEKIKTYFLCFITLSPENHTFCEIMCEKYGTAKKATDDYNTAHAHCMLDNQG
jgi:hypothetical protein